MTFRVNVQTLVLAGLLAVLAVGFGLGRATAPKSYTPKSSGYSSTYHKPYTSTYKKSYPSKSYTTGR